MIAEIIPNLTLRVILIQRSHDANKLNARIKNTDRDDSYQESTRQAWFIFTNFWNCPRQNRKSQAEQNQTITRKDDRLLMSEICAEEQT